MAERPRAGQNHPITMNVAIYDGHRSVRLLVPWGPGGWIGLATATYSYKLSDGERCEVARRMAALWNLHLDVPTDELEARAKPVLAAAVGSNA